MAQLRALDVASAAARADCQALRASRAKMGRRDARPRGQASARPGRVPLLTRKPLASTLGTPHEAYAKRVGSEATGFHGMP